LHRQMGQDENDMFNLARELEDYAERYERQAGGNEPPAFDPVATADDLMTQDVHPDGRLNLTAVHDTMYALQNGVLDYPAFRGNNGMNADEHLQASRDVLGLMANRLLQQGYPLPDFMVQPQLPEPLPAEINVDDLNLFEPDPGHPANVPARQAATPEQRDILDRLHANYLQQLQNPEQATLFFNDFMAQFPQLQGQERAVMNMIEIRVADLQAQAQEQQQQRQNPEGRARGGLVRPLMRNSQLASLHYQYGGFLH